MIIQIVGHWLSQWTRRSEVLPRGFSVTELQARIEAVFFEHATRLDFEADAIWLTRSVDNLGISFPIPPDWAARVAVIKRHCRQALEQARAEQEATTEAARPPASPADGGEEQG